MGALPSSSEAEYGVKTGFRFRVSERYIFFTLNTQFHG